MKQIRESAINALSALTRHFFQGSAIICLHRVLPVSKKSALAIPRDLEISPQYLETIVQIMREEGYNFVPLAQLLERLGTKPRDRYCAITFDDGYHDNLVYAFPVLEALGVPFTIYVTSGYINGSIEPWWYRLQRLLTSPVPIQFPSPSGEILAPGDLAAGERSFQRIYRQIKALPPVERDNHLLELEALNPEALLSTEAVPFLSNLDLVHLIDSGLVEIGAHTVSHPILTLLEPAVAEREMRDSKATIENWIGKPVSNFSYPHGQSNPELARIARKVGFRSATTTLSQMIRRSPSGLFELPRLCFGGELESRTHLRRVVRGVYERPW